MSAGSYKKNPQGRIRKELFSSGYRRLFCKNCVKDVWAYGTGSRAASSYKCLGCGMFIGIFKKGYRIRPAKPSLKASWRRPVIPESITCIRCGMSGKPVVLRLKNRVVRLQCGFCTEFHNNLTPYKRKNPCLSEQGASAGPKA